ncbi:MAG: hypothetical protein AB1414_09365 [bacterium]
MEFVLFLGTIISFILAGYIIWIHGIKPRITNVEFKDIDKFRNEVGKLITEFNRVSNTNINILEDKIEDLKNIIKLADNKIVKLNSMTVDLDILANRGRKNKEVEEIKEKPVERPKIKPLSKKATVDEKKEKIKELMLAGFSIEEIARAVNMSKTEVQLVLELKNKM